MLSVSSPTHFVPQIEAASICTAAPSVGVPVGNRTQFPDRDATDRHRAVLEKIEAIAVLVCDPRGETYECCETGLP